MSRSVPKASQGSAGGTPKSPGTRGDNEQLVRKSSLWDKITRQHHDPNALEIGDNLEGGMPSEPKGLGNVNYFPKGAKNVMNPQSSFMKRWDVMMVFALVFTAIVTPYEVAFLAVSFNWLFAVNRAIDIFFLTDMGVNMHLPFVDDTTGLWIVSLTAIRQRYLKFWFWVDLSSILPFDMVGLIVNSPNLSFLHILRTLRLLRLLKLLRIIRASRIFARWETHVAISYGQLALTKFLVYILIMSHWVACAWKITGDYAIDYIESPTGTPRSWYTEYSYITDPTDNFQVYVTALYWGIMTLTTIGYGDVTPTCSEEQIVVSVAMMIGAGMYGYVVGSICSIVANMDQATSNFRNSMDQLNRYMHETHLPDAMCVRLRQYFMACKELYRQRHYSSLLEQMAPSLRLQVSCHINYAWVRKIPFFDVGDVRERRDFTSDLTMTIQPEVFPPQEFIVRNGEKAERMYIVTRGVVVKPGKIFVARQFFGEDFLLDGARRFYWCRAMTYVTVQTLSREAMFDVLDRGEYPLIKRAVRRYTLVLRLQHMLLRMRRNLDVLAEYEGEPTGLSGEKITELMQYSNFEYRALLAERHAKDAAPSDGGASSAALQRAHSSRRLSLAPLVAGPPPASARTPVPEREVHNGGGDIFGIEHSSSGRSGGGTATSVTAVPAIVDDAAAALRAQLEVYHRAQLSVFAQSSDRVAAAVLAKLEPKIQLVSATQGGPNGRDEHDQTGFFRGVRKNWQTRFLVLAAAASTGLLIMVLGIVSSVESIVAGLQGSAPSSHL